MRLLDRPRTQLQTSSFVPSSAWVSAAAVIGILAGLGGASLLPEDSPWRWMLGLGGGILAAGAALAYLLWPILKTSIPKLLQSIRSLPAKIRSWVPVIRFQKRFPWLSITRQQSGAASDAQRLAPASARSEPREAIPWEVWQGLLVGASLLLPALVARLLELHAHGSGNLLVIYFSTPAILLWAGGQAASLYPHWIVRPKHLPQITGLLGGGMQLLGALLLWVHLGMDSGIEVSVWMFWLSAALAAGGALLQYISLAAQQGMSSGMSAA